MTTTKPRGRPPAPHKLTRCNVALPQSDIDDLRKWFGNASHGIRELVKKEKSARQSQLLASS